MASILLVSVISYNYIMNNTSNFWRKCSTCKKDLMFEQVYYKCSVSTCNRKRTGLVFCGWGCFDAHLPIARHKEAFADEHKSPSFKEYQLEQKLNNPLSKKQTTHSTLSKSDEGPLLNGFSNKEILVVASKVKNYIKEQGGMNTSANVMEKLTEHIVHVCNQSIINAKNNDRKTVLDRDVPKVKQ